MADTVNRQIVAALEPFGLPIAERLYRGKQDRYFVYYITDDAPADSGDDTVQAYVAYIQIHYICPLDEPYAETRRMIRRALVGAGFAAPEITDASDYTSHNEAEHVRKLVFETSIENEYDMEV